MNDKTQALDEWATQIAALEPEVSAGIVAYAKRLARDTRLPQADRDFAQAQADAVGRAIRQGRNGQKKTPKK